MLTSELMLLNTIRIYTPNADEVNIDVDTERLFECIGLLPALVVVAREHFVGEWNLLMVTSGQKSDLPRSDCQDNARGLHLV